MCGISAYIGYREAYPIVINGLKRLEYRGYDSAGVMLFDGTNVQLSKTKGKVSALEKITEHANYLSIMFSNNQNVFHNHYHQ